MKTLDRYIFSSLIVNYLIALAVMISLYMALDLFFNVDEFTGAEESAIKILRNIGSYYATHSFLYFSQLSGVITLFACVATIARLRRANELAAIVASGVSLYRVAVPVIIFGILTSTLWYIDAEVVIPSLAHRLARDHEDASGQNAKGVWFVNDGERNLVSARTFIPSRKEMEHLLVLHRNAKGNIEKVTEAEVAQWHPITGHPFGGVWKLYGGQEIIRQMTSTSLGPQEKMVPTPIYEYESELTPEAVELRQAQQWIRFLSSAKLNELKKREPFMTARIREVQHSRFAAPIVNILMMLLGVPFFLSREPANIIGDAGKCVLVCGTCFLLAFAGENFIQTDTLSALPSWLPLIIFAPAAVVLIDRIRT